MTRSADLSCHVVDLPCYHMASVRAFGLSPEAEAWAMLLEWAERTQRDPVSGDHRFFGFNDPSPSGPGQPYGYQQWMTVTPDVHVDEHEDVSIIDFSGGRFATTRCEGLGTIGDRWRQLFDYVAASELTPAPEPGLEELLTVTAADPAEFVFNLYLPVTPA